MAIVHAKSADPSADKAALFFLRTYSIGIVIGNVFQHKTQIYWVILEKQF
jgi:hypothetical protein